MRELLLETNVRRRKGIHRICPRCGKVGTLAPKWGSRVYYPKRSSVYVDLPYTFEQGYVTGEGYRRVTGDSETFDKKSSYKVRYPQEYKQWFIAHYESGGHRKQCSLRRGKDYSSYYLENLPRLEKPKERNYQRKKDLRCKDRLNQKISEIKNNGVCIVRERSDKKAYRLYLF